MAKHHYNPICLASRGQIGLASHIDVKSHNTRITYAMIKNNFTRILSFMLCAAASASVSGGQLSELFKMVSPAVVVLHTFEKIASPFPNKGLTSVQGLGSGVLISEDGKILTAAHVVQVADSVHVEFQDGQKTLAKVVASVPSADIALLQLDQIPKNISPARIGDSDKVNVGDDVFVIGAPYGASHTLTAGFVSARRAAEDANPFVEGEFFQTDAAINQGNSGGPLFNMQGEIIGIVSYIMTQSGGFEGLGFALTSNTATRLVFEEQAFWSGIDGKIISDQFAEIFHLPQNAGLLVERVAQDSPLDRAGIKGGEIISKIGDVPILLGGDIILEVAGIKLTEKNARLKIQEKLSKTSAKKIIQVIVYRAGKKQKLDVEIPN